MYKIKKEDAVFVAVDFQEKLMPAMKLNDELCESTIKLVKGLRVLNVPIIFTQQYTKGLGMTVEPIQKAYSETQDGNVESAEFNFVEKSTFSAMGEPEFLKALEATSKKSVIIAGIESHICVQQTVLDLLENGYTVFVINDCVASRNNTDKKFAQRRMGDAGAIGTTFEAILFELCGSARNPHFKQISKIVK